MTGHSANKGAVIRKSFLLSADERKTIDSALMQAERDWPMQEDKDKAKALRERLA